MGPACVAVGNGEPATSWRYDVGKATCDTKWNCQLRTGVIRKPTLPPTVLVQALFSQEQQSPGVDGTVQLQDKQLENPGGREWAPMRDGKGRRVESQDRWPACLRACFARCTKGSNKFTGYQTTRLLLECGCEEKMEKRCPMMTSVCQHNRARGGGTFLFYPETPKAHENAGGWHQL